MEKKSYSELLKDPRWQKKRLEIMQRDKFQCRACEEKEETLHVHHIWYDKDTMPWEYDNDDLVTLCKDCHELWGMIDKMLRGSGYGWEHLADIVDLFWKISTASMNKSIEEKKSKNNE